MTVAALLSGLGILLYQFVMGGEERRNRPADARSMEEAEEKVKSRGPWSAVDVKEVS